MLRNTVNGVGPGEVAVDAVALERPELHIGHLRRQQAESLAREVMRVASAAVDLRHGHARYSHRRALTGAVDDEHRLNDRAAQEAACHVSLARRLVGRGVERSPGAEE